MNEIEIITKIACRNPFRSNAAKEPTACTHICNVGAGCITKELACKHVHDDKCGYKEGTPCTFDPATCEICNAKDSGVPEEKQALMKAEPETLPLADQLRQRALLAIYYVPK